MSERKNTVLGVLLALVLAFSLAGISYYFPASQDRPSTVPELSVGEYSIQIPSPTGLSNLTFRDSGNFTVMVPINLSKITIRSDGTVDPQNVPIQRVGDLYLLTGNVSNRTLVIQRDNILIDGGGHKIRGRINAPGGIVLKNRNNVTIKDLQIIKFWHGIILTNCTDITLEGNNILDMGSRAITASSCNNTTISNNTINSFGIAIEITRISGFPQSTNNTIARNTITNAAQGITMESPFSNITENTLANIYIPIGARGNWTTISKNNLINGISGMYITGSHYTVYGNKVENFSESGITINSGVYSTVYENTVKNSNLGVKIGGYNNSSPVENNTFYHNDFINNTQQVYIGTLHNENRWDNSVEGNYWSDYNGTDSDGDGIGDTPHLINQDNADRYPLMEPYQKGSTQQSTQMVLVYLGIIGLIAFAAIIIATVLAAY